MLPTNHKARAWIQKFRHAIRGVRMGMRGQSSFAVHLFMAALVAAAGAVLRPNLVEWYVLALCIAMVLGAEMFNSALEGMAKAISREQDPHLADALDMGSAAVLIVALGAAAVGAAVFLTRLWAIWHATQ